MLRQCEVPCHLRQRSRRLRRRHLLQSRLCTLPAIRPRSQSMNRSQHWPEAMIRGAPTSLPSQMRWTSSHIPPAKRPRSQPMNRSHMSCHHHSCYNRTVTLLSGLPNQLLLQPREALRDRKRTIFGALHANCGSIQAACSYSHATLNVIPPPPSIPSAVSATPHISQTRVHPVFLAAQCAFHHHHPVSRLRVPMQQWRLRAVTRHRYITVSLPNPRLALICRTHTRPMHR